jgi:hypothetical protein
MSRKPLTAAEDEPTLVPLPSWSFDEIIDEIIRERTAGLSPEQKNGPGMQHAVVDVVRRAILKILMTQPDVPLTDYARRYVALELERLWIPKKELAKIERQRQLESAERALEVHKRAKELARKNGLLKRGRAGPTAIEAIRPALVKGRDGRTFHSSAALKQFLKRERILKRERQAQKNPRR